MRLKAFAEKMDQFQKNSLSSKTLNLWKKLIQCQTF